MFTRSHLEEMKRRYASMYASPVDNEVIEDGTIEGVNQYKKDTPGQGIEEDEIEEGLGLQLKMAFDDAKIKTKPRKGKIVIAKKDKKKAMDVLSKTLPSKLKKYVDKAVDNFLVFEEVELDEGKFKKGDIVIPNMGPHKGDKHEIIHDFGDGSYNIKPLTHPRNIKYKLGASKAKENQLKLVKEGVELNEGGDQIWFKGIGMTFDEFSLIFATMYVPGSRVLPTEVAPDNSKYGSLLKKLSRKDQKWVVSLLKDYMKRGGVVHKDVVKNFVLKEEVELDEATPMYPPTIKNLRMIVKDKQNQVFMFKVGKARVDLFTASAIIAVYDGLKKPEHKKKLEDMIKTKEGFLKTQAFAMKMVK
mgnify:CR=1 FL=1